MKEAENKTTFPLRLSRFNETADVDCWPLEIQQAIQVTPDFSYQPMYKSSVEGKSLHASLSNL